MKQERDAEREHELARQRAEQTAITEKRAKVEDASKRLSALFNMDDKPQERGKLLEAVLNDLFRAYDIHVREDFRRRDPDSQVVLEQMDGVIVLDGAIHLVEMKWLKDPVGVAEFGPHLVRVFGRANASAIFISNSSFTGPVIKQCTEFLDQRTTFLCSLQEIVMLLLQRKDDPGGESRRAARHQARRSRGEDRMIHAAARVLKDSNDVFTLEIGIIIENLLNGKACCQQVQNICDADTHPSNARAAAALLRIHCDALEQIRH
jgi:hypothetical protein